MALFEKHWTKYLSSTIMPTDQQIHQLESLRFNSHVDHKSFSDVVSKSPATLRRAVEDVIGEVKRCYPQSTASEALRITYAGMILNWTLLGTGIVAHVFPAIKFQEQLANYVPDIKQRLEEANPSLSTIDTLVVSLLTEPEFNWFRRNPNTSLETQVDQILGWYSSGPIARNEGYTQPGHPTWASRIPDNITIENRSIIQLERLRTINSIPDDTFYDLVMESPGITNLVFSRQYTELKKRYPHATDQEVFRQIISTRYVTTDIADGFTEAARHNVDDFIAQSAINNALQTIHSISDVTRYIVENYEEFWTRTPDPFAVNRQIAEILGYHR